MFNKSCLFISYLFLLKQSDRYIKIRANLGFDISELVFGSGENKIHKYKENNVPWLLPVAFTVTASIPLLLSALITWNLILISFCKEN